MEVGTRVRIARQPSGLDKNWIGLTGRIVRTGGGVVGLCGVELDEGLVRPDEFTGSFYWHADHLEVLSDDPAEPDDRTASLRKSLAEKDREFEEFRDTVRRVAMDYATRHGWCSVVSDALQEMGIDSHEEIKIMVTGYATVRLLPDAVPQEEYHHVLLEMADNERVLEDVTIVTVD